MSRKIIRKGINKRNNQRKRGSSGGHMFQEVDSYTVTLWNRTNTAGFNSKKKCPS